jgi:hypothetical protein
VAQRFLPRSSYLFAVTVFLCPWGDESDDNKDWFLAMASGCRVD